MLWLHESDAYLHIFTTNSGQASFLYKIKKLSSRFSETQILKISKNSVLAQKLSSKPPKKRVFKQIFDQNDEKMYNFSLKNPEFLENSDLKLQKLSFSEIS